jgi:mono/diheme cytochrome c family protein
MKLSFIIGLLLIGVAFVTACQSDDQLEFSRYYSGGRDVYQSKCQNCHGVKGEGLQSLIPPLTDSLYLKANKAKLACSIKYGVKGKLNMAQKQFDGEMPANDLTGIQLAEVLTYITNSFNNKLGVVTTQQVTADLANCN